MASERRKRTALVVTSVLLGCLLIETGGCLAGVRLEAVNWVTRDPMLGWVPRAGTRGWQVAESGFYHVQINADGQRDREHSLQKPPHIRRIAVLGDSFTLGIGVPMEATFVAVLERELNRRLDLGAANGAGCSAWAGTRVETINFGVSGYGAAQELLLLRRTVWKYDPDLVLLAAYAGNDVSDGVREICWDTTNTRPYFIFDGEGLVLDNSFQQDPGFHPWRIQLLNVWRDLKSSSYVVAAIDSVLRIASRNGSANSSRQWRPAP